MDVLEREYDYNLSRGVTIGSALFLTSGSAIFAWRAETNDRGLILNGIPMEQGTATMFYAAMAAVAFVAAATMVWLSLRRAHIGLSQDALIVPASWWSTGDKRIPYRDIVGIRLGIRRSAISGAQQLVIY